jgi:hypothetical protein
MWQGDGGVAIPSADVLGHGAFEEMPIRPLNLLGSASPSYGGLVARWKKILLWNQADFTCPDLSAKIFRFPSDPNHF